MAGEWRSTTIGDLCDEGIVELQTGPFGSQLHAHDYVDHGIPVVPTEAIRDRRIDHSVLPEVSPSKAAELKRHRLDVGDILFARRGVQATGHIGCVREAEAGFLCGTGAIRLRINKGHESVSPDFLSHVLANPAAIDWFKFHAIGATMPNLNEGIIRSFPLQIPSVTEQRAIAHVLGTLDDKIELNRRMSETLEAMAQALFKSWFVDFDPVRAKAEGRDPGLPTPLADLFPARLIDSELGEIPEGWKVGVVSTMAEVTTGKRPEVRFSNPAPDASVPLWGGNGPMAFVPESLFNEPLLLTGRVGTLGSVFRISGPCWPSDNTLVVRANRPADIEYLFFQLRLIDFASLNRGSTQPLLTQTDLRSQPLLLPVPAVLDHFSRIASSTYKRIDQAEEESRTLSAVRDALLPKLISGEMRLTSLQALACRAA